MAGSAMVFTERTQGSVRKIKCAWTTDDTTGAVSGTTTYFFSGRFIGLITDPGSPAPSDNYTLIISDIDGVDLLLGAATANRHTTTTQFLAEASMAGAAWTRLTFAVSSAGNSKRGIAYLLIR